MGRPVFPDQDFDGLITTVYELTVGEVRDYHATQTQRTEQIAQALHAEDWDRLKGLIEDPVSENLLQGVSLDDLARFTDLDRDTLMGAYPSQLRQIEARIREANPDFFEMRERMAKTLQNYAAGQAGRTNTPDSPATS